MTSAKGSKRKESEQKEDSQAKKQKTQRMQGEEEKRYEKKESKAVQEKKQNAQCMQAEKGKHDEKEESKIAQDARDDARFVMRHLLAALEESVKSPRGSPKEAHFLKALFCEKNVIAAAKSVLVLLRPFVRSEHERYAGFLSFREAALWCPDEMFSPDCTLVDSVFTRLFAAAFASYIDTIRSVDALCGDLKKAALRMSEYINK